MKARRQIGARYIARVRGAFKRGGKKPIGTSGRLTAARCTIAQLR
jgi:hypothetical protein